MKSIRKGACALLAALTAVLLTPALGRAAARGRSASLAGYYLALGDSLATGAGTSTGNGYVSQIFAWAQVKLPDLRLANLGCGGDSTTRMIEGGLCENYATGDQLGDAEEFLRNHPGQTQFVTIDVGGDDVVGCAASGTIYPACIQQGLEHVVTNMPVILEGLREAGGAKLPIVGMTYYDPILGFYLAGAAGEQTARESVSILKSLDHDLTKAYRRFHVKVANVEKAFATTDWRTTGSYDGMTLPQNVANICNWTHQCEGELEGHTNDRGYEIIASKYEPLLKSAVR